MKFPSVTQLGATNNFVEIEIGDLSLYFSYETLIAYSDAEDGKVFSKNHWSMTTGKHLTMIDGGQKDGRLPKADFDVKVAAMMRRHGFEA